MRFPYNASRLLLIAAIAIIWQLLSQYSIINPLVFSSPVGSLISLYNMLSGHSTGVNFYSSFDATLIEIALAYVAVAAIGVPAGIALGWNRFAQNSIMPLIIAFFSIPSVVLYPIIYLIFGLGFASKVIFGTIVGLFAVLENSSAGAKQIPRDFILLSNSLGFTRLQLLRKIVIPSALPYITSGLRLGLSLALAGIIAGEYIASTTGLGQLMVTSLDLLKIDDLYGGILLVVGIASLVNFILIFVEAREAKFKVFY